tara:strand:+ start:412 stop:1533 length:1122 start_codon:yes stop_codon:yes gene_type:complete
MMKKNKPINMATGGLMNMPPFIKKAEEEKEKGITPYDVNTPKEARQGLPTRLLSPSRTRFEVGGNLDKDGSGDITQKDILIARGVLDGDGNMISKKKAAYGGLMKRQKYNVGDEVAKLKRIKLPIDDDVLDEDTFEEAPAEGDIPGEANAVKDILLKRMIEQKETQLELTDDTTEQNKIKKDIEQLKLKMTKVKAATGGLLKMSIGGAAGTSERYDRRKDYQAYAEGDMVEDESLMTPTGMNTEEMDGIAEANMEMEAEDNMDMGDMDAVVDTSALSEEEEKVVDDAVEMFPELEAIIPKIVATEFTDDGEVEGPGTGTSDSIPALLSDGEFVFTAKAVKHIGVDKLRKMMKDAEAAYDAGMQSQEADAAMAE